MSDVSPLHYVEQSAADLAFYLFESPAPRGAIRVLAERTLRLRGGQITLAIIGSSHFLEVRAGKTALSEVVACPRPGLEDGTAPLETDGRRSWERQLRRGGIGYRFRLHRRTYRRGMFEKAVARLAAEGECRMHFSFPEGGGAEGALTSIEWRVEGHRAIVTTAHTFPSELSIVHTRSVIDVSQPGVRS